MASDGHSLFSDTSVLSQTWKKFRAPGTASWDCKSHKGGTFFVFIIFLTELITSWEKPHCEGIYYQAHEQINELFGFAVRYGTKPVGVIGKIIQFRAYIRSIVESFMRQFYIKRVEISNVLKMLFSKYSEFWHNVKGETVIDGSYKNFHYTNWIKGNCKFEKITKYTMTLRKFDFWEFWRRPRPNVFGEQLADSFTWNSSAGISLSYYNQTGNDLILSL